jgi:hypothetical protein
VKRIIALLVAALLVGMVSTASFAQTTYPDPGTAVTNVIVQNKSTTDAAVVSATYYNPNGTVAHTGGAINIAPRAVVEIKTEDEPLSAGFKGAAVLSSNQPVAAVVSTQNRNVAASAGERTQSAYNGTRAGASQLYFPSLFRFQFIVSSFTVQNTSNVDANIQLQFSDRQGSPKGSATDMIPAHGSKTYDLRTYSPGAAFNDFIDGSVVVTATTGQIAGAAITTYANRSAAYQALTNTNQGTTLYAPSLFRFRHDPAIAPAYTLFSALNLQNTSNQVANVNVKFYSRADGSLTLDYDLQIQPLSAAGINLKNGGDFPIAHFNAIPDTWDGSAIITSNQPLVGVGITNWDLAGYAGNYVLVTPNDGADRLFVPAQYRLDFGTGQFQQWSAINLQNVGNATISRNDLTLEYINTAGTTVATFTGNQLPFDLGPGAALGLNTRNGGDLAASAFNAFGMNFIGGIYITAPAGSQLVGVANIIYSNRASVYNADPAE